MEDVERLLRWSAAAAALTATYALVQLVAGNGKFFWFYEPPYGNTLDAARANFTNRNHFAQFLALGTGPLIWWVHDAFRKNRASPCTTARLGAATQQRHEGKTYLLALTLGLLLFAGLLSLSRGGMAAIVLAAALTAAVCWHASAGNKSFVVILAGVGILVALLLNIFGLDRVRPRLEDLQSCSVQRLDGQGSRRSIWTAVARGVQEFSALGTGVGSHAEAYPIYYSNELYEEDNEFTHAESSYLQVALETGFAGLALVVAAVVCCGVWCVGGLIRAPSARIVACLGAVTGSLAASAVHALVDFVWYVPACMVMIVILSACAARLWRLARSPLGQPSAVPSGQGPEVARHSRVRSDSTAALQGGWVLPRLAYLAAAAVLLSAGAWTIKTQVQAAVAEPAWDSYRKSRIAMEKELERSPEATLDDARRAGAQKAEGRRIDLLEAVVRRQPDHARAHLDLVESYLRLFDMIQVESENPMSLANVRDAAQRSHFPSREALDAWLRRAVGEHAQYLDRALGHVRRAMALCPLQGRGYLYLAELCFLENAGEGWKRACIEQALRIRPFDGEVLYAAATEALLAGDYDRWLEFARRSFQCGRRHQRRLIADLIGRSPPEVLEDVIQGIVGEFQPDLEALRGLREAARQHARPEKSAWLERHIAERAEADAKSARGEAAARLWNEARGLYASIGDAVRAAECAKSAAASDPQSFEARYGLGLTLMAQGQPAEAEPHLRWCLQRRPNDSGVEAKWKEALKGRLDEHRETATRRADRRHSF
jgi:O-antigen ligase/tetratricopeptide (TPR) repeat protein